MSYRRLHLGLSQPHQLQLVGSQLGVVRIVLERRLPVGLFHGHLAGEALDDFCVARGVDVFAEQIQQEPVEFERAAFG